jgi:hypothetical protein
MSDLTSSAMQAAYQLLCRRQSRTPKKHQLLPAPQSLPPPSKASTGGMWGSQYYITNCDLVPSSMPLGLNVESVANVFNMVWQPWMQVQSGHTSSDDSPEDTINHKSEV